MVSVVMEGAVVMNSFPPRAVPSTCGQRKESSERDTEREKPDSPAAPAPWVHGSPSDKVTGYVSERVQGARECSRTD